MTNIDPAIVDALTSVGYLEYPTGSEDPNAAEWAVFIDDALPAIAPLLTASRAEAWDEGYATCLGDFDIAARRESRSPNPHGSAAHFQCIGSCLNPGLHGEEGVICGNCAWIDTPTEDQP